MAKGLRFRGRAFFQICFPMNSSGVRKHFCAEAIFKAVVLHSKIYFQNDLVIQIPNVPKLLCSFIHPV